MDSLRGKRIIGEIYDELPDPRLMTEQERERYYNHLKTFSQSLVDGSNGLIKGTVVVFGTGGDDVDNLKQMFYDPNTYNIIDYTQEETKAGFFKPNYMDTETRKGEYHSMISQGIEIKEDAITVNVPKGMQVIDVINNIIEGSTVDKNLISDGYHTFGELYEHRIELFLTVCRLVWHEEHQHGGSDEESVWKTKIHSDGTSWDGWFLLGIGKEKGKQMTYHLPISKWKDCEFAEVLDIAPEFDGHSSADVLERLKNL